MSVASPQPVPDGPVLIAPPGPRPFARVAEPDAVRAVYTPPKIVKTTLAAYEDEKGRLFGPQEMYEKVEEGRFNTAALENPELAYIPPENLVVPPGMGNPVSMPAMRHRAEEQPKLATDFIDPRDVAPTGLFARVDDRAAAERMAERAGRRAVYDADLGWLLVPVTSAQ